MESYDLIHLLIYPQVVSFEMTQDFLPDLQLLLWICCVAVSDIPENLKGW